MSMGAQLAARRGELGLTIDQVAAATRIRPRHIEALEEGRLADFAAPVYAAGCLGAYARHLGLDPATLVAQVPAGGRRPGLGLDLENRHRRPGALISVPALVAAFVVLLAGGVAGYAWRQVVSDPHPGSGASAESATSFAAGASTPAPAAQPRSIVVGVRVTEEVWINAAIDGRPQYGDSGKTLAAGSVVFFTGVEVKITTGKASATFISIDGRNLGPLGIGVATRDFSSQTSP
jgi:cytoskeletal protein RodZ